jgi:hypothetical protein
MVKADLHNHLRTSSNLSDSDFNATINTSLRRLGPEGIVGLVNFDDKRYEQFINLKGYERTYVGEKSNGIYAYAPRQRGIFVIKGQEVPTQEGHLLVFGLGKDVHLKQHRNLKDTLKEAKDNNGIVVVDHPFHSHGLGTYLEHNKDMINEIDAIEVHNGEAALGLPHTPFPYRANQKAQEFYDRMKQEFPHLGALSSSDGHSLYEIGSSWTEIGEPDIWHNYRFVDSLRDSVRDTNNQTSAKRSNSVVGALDHMLDLAFIIKVAPKIGLSKRFETERPQ